MTEYCTYCNIVPVFLKKRIITGTAQRVSYLNIETKSVELKANSSPLAESCNLHRTPILGTTQILDVGLKAFLAVPRLGITMMLHGMICRAESAHTIRKREYHQRIHTLYRQLLPETMEFAILTNEVEPRQQV